MARRSHLSEREARAIALAWRDQLHGCVRLETDRMSSPASLVPVFASVAFVLNGTVADGLRDVKDTKDTAASARAATIAWAALSDCAGYSARENPHFWRRVFSELTAVEKPIRFGASGTKKPFPYRPQLPISDAVQFFDCDEETSFPRVRFVAKFPQDSASVRAFLAPSDNVDRKLLKSLKRLAPFIRPAMWNARSIPVTIEGLDIEEVVRVVWKNHKTNVDIPELLPSLPCPQFQLDTVVLRRQDTRSTVAIEDVKTLVPHAQIVADECEFSHLFHVQRGPLDLLVTFGSYRDPLFSLHTLSLARSIGSRAKFAVACSSLPHVDSIAKVELSSQRFEVKSMGLDECAWLGYAVFHPDNFEASPCTQLILRLPYVRDVAQHVLAFKSMATGNNLLTALGSDAPPSSAYFRSRIPAGAVVRLASTYEVITAIELELTSALWCTLCVTTTDLSKLTNEWIQAVIPGYGLGKVKRKDIVEIVAAPPHPSCVRHLRLELPDVVSEEGELVQWIISPLLDLLSVLGPALVSLDMADSLSMGTTLVQAILECCPLLETLRISHDGAFWNSECSEPELPRLRELELCVDATAGFTSGLQPLCSSSLSSLRVLRVKTMQHKSFFETQRTFPTALATYPDILYGHWCYTGVKQFTTYEKRRQHSLSLQRQMDLGHSDVTQVAMRLDGKLAFLSVIRDGSLEASALSAFGPDILRNIFSFSTSPVPRSVYIGCD